MTISQFKSICIFASPRSGSNLLVEQLSSGLTSKYNINAKAFYEYLSPHNYINEKFECVYIDREHVLPRPFRNGLDLYRLEKLKDFESLGVFPVFKLFPNDHSVDNRLHIKKYILDDPTVFKICLNRKDIINQILSYCIGMSTGVWHIKSNTVSIEDKIWRKYHVSDEMLHDIGSTIMLHQLWHVEQAKQYCNRTVWYHELTSANWPELELTCEDLSYTKLIKSTHDHVDIGSKSILNFEEVYNYAKMINKNLTHIMAELQ